MDAAVAPERKAALIRAAPAIPTTGGSPCGSSLPDVLGSETGTSRPWWYVCALFLGLYLSVRGYHSLDGDQTYRLPLLLHRQEPSLYEDDPFVRRLDAFNPHRGSLIVLDAVTRPLGLSAGLFLLFILTFLLTCRAVERLAREVWPESGPKVGWVAVGLLLAAKAGNIGTNHLFEAMVLDRLIAFALGWQALAHAVMQSGGTLVAASARDRTGHLDSSVRSASSSRWYWQRAGSVGRCSAGTMDVRARVASKEPVALTLAVLPGLAINLPRETSLSGDLPGDVFWLLSVELQSPQHMLPHLWRMPQWLSWSCYLVLAVAPTRPFPGCAGMDLRGAAGFLATGSSPPGCLAGNHPGRTRHRVVCHRGDAPGSGDDLPAFPDGDAGQGNCPDPRRGTPDRCSGNRPGRSGSTRAILLATGFFGDWLLVVVTAAELTVSALEASVSPGEPILEERPGRPRSSGDRAGLNFLLHHDTESGNRPLLIALVVGLAVEITARWRGRDRTGLTWSRLRTREVGRLWSWRRRGSYPSLRCWRRSLRWTILAATSVLMGLIDRCRFLPVPVDDIERLALWCREHTPGTARFIGPPGPKTFRLWARRSVAFNRAASPVSRRGPGGLVRPISGSRQLPCNAGGIRARLSGAPTSIRSAVRGPQRCPACLAGRSPGGS